MAESFPSPASAASAQFFVVTPNDTTELPYAVRSLYVGGGGDVSVKNAFGVSVLFKAVPTGSVLPVRTSTVMATGTTATNIVGLA